MLAQMKIRPVGLSSWRGNLNDYVFGLTDKGRERARRHAQISTYYGATPVALSDYIESVKSNR